MPIVCFLSRSVPGIDHVAQFNQSAVVWSLFSLILPIALFFHITIILPHALSNHFPSTMFFKKTHTGVKKKLHSQKITFSQSHPYHRHHISSRAIPVILHMSHLTVMVIYYLHAQKIKLVNYGLPKKVNVLVHMTTLGQSHVVNQQQIQNTW